MHIFKFLIISPSSPIVSLTKTPRTLAPYPSYSIAILIFIPAEETINPIKKCTKGVPKTNSTNEIITSNNTTKQPDDIGQLVTYFSCDILQTAPPSQICTMETIIFRLV